MNRVEEGKNVGRSKMQKSKAKGQLCNFYSATALIIHDSGDKFPKGIIVINDKILILDTKNRYEF